MRMLQLPDGCPLTDVVREVADRDAMYAGSRAHYVQVGLSALQLIEEAVGGAPEPRRILDLPCGHGRVTRFLRARYPDAQITVSDVDRDGVDFAAARFRAEPVHSDGDFRTLRLGAPFDLIWIGSLVTHLPALETRRLLDSMVRHMAPGATLVLTSHGEHVAERIRAGATYGLPAATARGVLREYEATGYGYRNYWGGEGYGISLIAPAWYDAVLAGSPLRLRRYLARGWDDHQDVLALGLAPAPVLDSLPARIGRRLGLRRNSGPAAGQGWFEAAETGQALHVPGSDELAEAAADVAASGEPSSDEAPPGFDEAWYLAHHADVGAAVAQGDYESGLEHYLRYGREEGRAISGTQGARPAAGEAGPPEAAEASTVKTSGSGTG